MADIFVNYYHLEPERAKGIADALRRLKHEVFFLKPGDDWRQVVPRKLYESDAVIALLTQRSIKDRWTSLERGMAVGIQRIHGRGTIMPVILEADLKIPEELQADYAYILGVGLNDVEIADQIHAAIGAYDRAVKIFISHSHADRELAAALRGVLEQAFELVARDIRATSLIGGNVPTGTNIADTLRQDLEESRVVLGVVTPDSTRSAYVLFELGASWGLQRPTYPLLARGTTAADLPGPWQGIKSLNLAEETDCHDLLDQLEKEINLKRKKDVSARIAAAIRDLTRVAQVV